MAYKITVWTEDDNEYDLGKTFSTRDAAEEELDDIILNGAEIEGSPIEFGKVSEE